MVVSAVPLFILLFCCSINLGFSVELIPDALLTAPDIIRKYGYPSETHSVTTEDGYILVLHRIPSGRNFSRCFKKMPVLLIHGILGSSIVFLDNTEKSSLGFILADAGYDVWLANLRGNSYSHKHHNLSYTDQKYWEFCFDQHGKIDVPTMIDYILDLTHQSSVYVACHSMGCLSTVILIASKPEYKFKVKGVVAMAPAWGSSSFGGKLFPLLVEYTPLIASTLQEFKIWEFPPTKEGEAGFFFCKLFPMLCYILLNFVDGYYFDGYNLTRLDSIVQHYPDISSQRSFQHYAQWHLKNLNGTAYDFENPALNYMHYKQLTPPQYDFRSVDIPIAVIWGANDYLADPTDVANGVAQLPRVKLFYQVPDLNYNHNAFLFAKNVKELVYDKVIEMFQVFNRRCF